MTPQEKRIAELEEEVRQLRALMKPDIPFPDMLALAPRQADVLSVLYARPNSIVSRHKLEMLIWPDREISGKLVNVVLNQMKIKLDRFGVVVVNIRGRGWVLTEAARAKIDAMRRLQ